MNYGISRAAMVSDLHNTNFDSIVSLRRAIRFVIDDIKQAEEFGGQKTDPIEDPLQHAYEVALDFSAAVRYAAEQAKDPTQLSPIYWAALTACLDLRSRLLEREGK